MYDVKQLEHVCNSGMLMLMTTTPEIWSPTDLCVSSSVTQIFIICSAVNKLCFSFHIIFPPDYQLITFSIRVFLLVNQSDQTHRKKRGSNL